MSKIRSGLLVGCGNPLLDISANVDKEFLEKYQLKPNDAILASEMHMSLYQELIHDYNAEFIAGGSVQNTLRVCQWILQKPNVTAFFGCVGNDNYARILEEKAIKDNLIVRYQHTDKAPTGTCGVMITGTHRSLCANLAAANHFSIDHLRLPENRDLLEKAEFYYISGFFLTVSPNSIMEVAELANQYNKTSNDINVNNKSGHGDTSNSSISTVNIVKDSKQNRKFMMNLSAPFLSEFYFEPLMAAMPYVNILFGNEQEVEAFARQHHWTETEPKAIGHKIVKLPTASEKNDRIVVITQGHLPVLLFRGDRPGIVEEFPVERISPEKVVDTNGAGEAFVGGFLAYYIQQAPLDVCIRCGIWAASQIIQRSGCTFDGKPQFCS